LTTGGGLLSALGRLLDADDVEQIGACQALRVACALGLVEAQPVWGIVANREWLGAASTRLDPGRGPGLFAGLLELLRREEGRMRWAFPELLLSLVDELPGERGRGAALQAVRASVVGDAMGVLRGLVGGPRHPDLLPHFREWRDQFQELRA